jgi:phosphoglycolate phosphatase-like HAD superfamily hydrolase
MRIMLLTFLGMLVCSNSLQAADDPLPSWNEGQSKKSILDFVARVTKKGSADFIPPEDRIAVFDHDGTLWPENPVPFEVAFTFDRIKMDAAKHPEWKTKQPYQAVLDNDQAALTAQGMKGVLELVTVTHSGMTTDEFTANVREWMKTAKHPRFDRPYTELAYQPMLELLRYLRKQGFKTFIVSGGTSQFMRVFTSEVYGIPPEQVVGTLFKVKFEMRSGKPVLAILPDTVFIDDKEGKPVGIQQLIGRQPLAAFGNSDGDLQMLQWTTIDRKPSFGLIVHHTDAEREYAYDAHPKSSGKLIEALKEAPERGWTVVDMKRDWKTIFSEAKK